QLNQLDEKTANAIFDILNKFAGYGFNKSHSAAYAILSYQTGYLKANYPVQFMAAMLSSELGNTEKVAHFIAECESMGLKVLGPDVNESGQNFTPVGVRPGAAGAIRFGLAGIKGVGEQAAERMLAERAAAGPFRDFADFLLRADARAINKRVLENLIAAGAFDFSGEPREALFEQVDLALSALGDLQRRYPALRKELPGAAAAVAPAESMLFDMAETAAPLPAREDLVAEFAEVMRHSRRAPADGNGNGNGHSDRHGGFDFGHATAPKAAAKAAPAAAERKLTAATRLQFEKELLGFYVSGHPLNAYRGLVEAIDTFPAAELPLQPDRTEFRLCGIAGEIAKKLAKKDNRPWAAFNLATKRSSVPLNMFADAFASYGPNLAENNPVIVLGNIIGGSDGARINVKECYPLEPAVASLVRKITWLLRPGHPEVEGFLRQLRTAVEKQS